MTIELLLPMFSPTFAPAGTGKLPSGPFTVIMRPAMAGPDAAADALALAAAELVLDELAAGDPLEHAAINRLTAQAARANEAKRNLFIGFLR